MRQLTEQFDKHECWWTHAAHAARGVCALRTPDLSQVMQLVKLENPVLQLGLGFGFALRIIPVCDHTLLTQNHVRKPGNGRRNHSWPGTQCGIWATVFALAGRLRDLQVSTTPLRGSGANTDQCPGVAK